MISTLSDSLLIVGDDLLVTNPKRVQKAIDEKACNAAVIKPNQIGTVTETLNVVKMVKDAGWKVVVSHRSGETNDSFIADFAVGVAADYIKSGIERLINGCRTCPQDHFRNGQNRIGSEFTFILGSV